MLTVFPIGEPTGQIPNVLVRDITNGTDLYSRNPDDVFVFPASCTKLMTLLLMYEYKNSVWTSESVTLTSDDVAQPIPGLTLDMAGFQAGDITTWEHLAYAILLPSSCEACQATARIVGDLLYANAGNTGDQGITRFIERMNSRAAELGMTNAVYFDSFGGSKVGSTTRNTISARDLTTLCKTVFLNTILRPIAGTATLDIVLTGSNPRTLTLTGYNRFTNGPTLNQSGIKDANVIGGKNGVWLADGLANFSLTHIWTSPNGTEVVLTTLGSQTLYGMMLDQRGLMYSLIRDFPYLATGTNTGGDSSWTSVQVLVGADGSIVDESSKAHTITVTDVTLGSPIIDSPGGLLIANQDSVLTITHDSGLAVVSQDMVAEQWFCGTGSSPSTEYVFFAKGSNANSDREWLINEFQGSLQVFASSDGSNWNSAIGVQFSTNERATFFNGAPRHLALVKNSGILAVFVNGEKCGNSVSMSSTFAGSGPLGIGNANFATVAAFGGIDDFRLTVGTPRYTTNMVTLAGREFPRSLLPPPPPPPPPSPIPPPTVQIPRGANDFGAFYPMWTAGVKQ